MLLDVRQAIVACDQSKNKVLKDSDSLFNQLIRILKDRKTEFITFADSYFKKERETLVENEEKWKEKQLICEELLKLNAADNGDEALLRNSRFIVEGLERLDEPVAFSQIKLINSLDTSLHTSSLQNSAKGQNVQIPAMPDITSTQLTQLLKKYIEVGEYKTLQYRS